MPVSISEVATLAVASELTVSIEPVWNILESLVLISQAEQQSGFHSWVGEVRDLMTEAERQTNQLVVIGFYFGILPDRKYASFPAYLRYLEATTPEALRDKMLDSYARLSKKCEEEDGSMIEGIDDLDLSSILSSPDVYLEFLKERFPPDHIDEELERRAYAYVVDPSAMKEKIVAHLNHMWDSYLSAEWERVTPMLQDCVRAFTREDLRGMTRLEAAQWITDHKIEENKWVHLLESNEKLVFVPNAHIGPYIWHFEQAKTHYILFGARLPEGSMIDAPDLSRTEIQVRLSALADDTRLRILRFIAENGEQRSQEIINALELSQSAASRHLTQLSATGLLSERRCEGAKCYQLNQGRVEETMHAVASYLMIA